MTFTQTFGGTTIYPAGVSYRAVALSADQTLSWPVETATNGNIVAQIMDVTPSAGSLSIIMPPANEVSVGETTLFFNPGAFSFTVKDNGGNTIVAIAPGLSYQVYLIGNSTVNGTWRSTQYAAGTSVATAGSLVGAGIKAISSTLNQSMSVTTLNSNYAIGDADRSEAFVWNGGAGAFTLPSSGTVGNDWFCQIRNSGTGAITLTPTGSELINGAPNLTFNPGDSAIVICDGSAFFTIGFGQSAAFAFDYVSIDLSSPVTSPYTLSGANLNRIAYSFGGTLTANMEVLIPATIQQYWISNDTSGAFSLTVKVAGQTGVVIPQGSRGIYYCNGTDIIDADTASFAFPLTVAQGGTGATTESGARVNLGGTSVGIGVFTAATAADGRNALIAAKSGANSDITSLTGLTTPLSVPQGGTGVATLTANGVVLGNGASALAVTAVGTTGQVLVGNTGAAPTWSTLSGIGVTSFSAGSTGLTPSTATTGVVTLAGTLGVANGGTGATTLTSGYLLKGNGTSAVSASVVYDNGSDVGIGTASPGSKFDVVGRIGATATQTFLFNGTTGTYGTFQYNGTNVGDIGTANQVVSGGANTDFAMTTRGATSLLFGTNTTERMRIDSAGDVGIGTSSPVSRLNVSGTTGFTWPNGGGTSSGLVTIGTQGTGGSLFVNTASLNTGFASGLAIDGTYSSLSSVVNIKAVGVKSGGGYNASLAFHTSFETTLAERMRIDSSGNVGIGTTGPSSYGKLAVIGNIASSTDGGTVLTMRANAGATTVAAYNATGSFLSFNTNASGSGEVERMRITSAGDVFVGGTAGNGRLTVRGAGTGAAYSFETATSGGATRFILSDNGEASFYNSSSAISMRIDSSGNVGIGTSSPGAKLQVAQASVGALGAQFALHNNTTSTVGNAVEICLLTDQGASPSGIRNARIRAVNENAGNGAANMQFWTWNGSTDAERMRIDSSGNVGIGTSSPGYKLVVSAASNTNPIAVISGSTKGLRLGADANGGIIEGVDNTGAASYQSMTLGGADIRFTTSSTERMRIDSSGNLLVGTTSTSPNPGIALVPAGAMAIGNNAQASGWGFINFNRSGTTIGSITQSGTTAVLYNLTSDARLKENVADADDAASLIDAIQVRKFDWKSDGSHQRYGFVAQELVEVAPEAVHSPEDPDEMMAVDYSKLVPMLVKELQSVRARLAELEGK